MNEQPAGLPSRRIPLTVRQKMSSKTLRVQPPSVSPDTHNFHNRMPQYNNTLQNLLSPDERYEIHVVKAAERPHLLRYTQEEEIENTFTEEEKKSNREHDLPSAVIDGSDIPGWRRSNVCSLTQRDRQSLEPLWNIGMHSLASTYLRRDSQWPIIHILKQESVWEALRHILSIPPAMDYDAPVLEYNYMCQTVQWENGRTISRFSFDIEQANVPAKIVDAPQVDRWKSAQDDTKWT